MPLDPTLEFAVDLASVRDRVAALSYFNAVEAIQDATNVFEQFSVVPPAAFVSVARESAEPNRMATGPISQRVTVDLSTLFAVPAERRDGGTGDEVEATRLAVIRILHGFTPTRALKPLEYVRYQLRATGDGLVWGEVIMRTVYRLDQPSAAP
jgi:hypothetical protein